MDISTSNINGGLMAHAGHYHPEKATAIWNDNVLMIVSTLTVVAVLVLVVVLFDALRDEKR